jgi:hypothetical protein
VFNLKSAFSLLFAGRKQYPLPKATLACFLAAPGGASASQRPMPRSASPLSVYPFPVSTRSIGDSCNAVESKIARGRTGFGVSAQAFVIARRDGERFRRPQGLAGPLPQGEDAIAGARSMIPKSGCRFSEKIMLQQ